MAAAEQTAPICTVELARKTAVVAQTVDMVQTMVAAMVLPPVVAAAVDASFNGILSWIKSYA